jgi:hypothetical protein
MGFHGIRTELTLPVRKELRDAVVSAVMEWGGDEDKPFPNITFQLKSASWMPPPYRLVSKARLLLTMDKPEQI